MAVSKNAARPAAGGLVDNAKTILYAVLIAVGIRTVAFEPFNIPSGSMIPTLLIGDYLFVAKYAYGYSHFSLPFSPPIFAGRIFGSLPARGDVVVFKYPGDTSEDYIKRVIGLPGDHVQMRAGQLYINNVLVPRTSVGDYVTNEGGVSVQRHEYLETLPNGVRHSILKETENGPYDNTPDFLITPDHVFCMGDNRDNSSDSRVPLVQGGVGYVPVENLVGKAEFIFFSVDGRDPWWQVWEWPLEIRWSRLFKGIG